jgi:hypothetical protein
MFKTVLKASVLISLAFPLSVVASPLEAQYAQRGYDVLVQRGAIISTSSYSKVLREAITLIGQGNSVADVSRKTGVNILVLQKILRLGTPIPAVDPKTIIQATLPVPEPPPITVKAPELLPARKLSKPKIIEKPSSVIVAKKIILPKKVNMRRSKAKFNKKSKTVLASNPKYVEGYGMGYFEGDDFKISKKFKYKFRIVKDFFSEQVEQSGETTSVSEERLSPSQRALMDLQRRHPEVKGIATSP